MSGVALGASQALPSVGRDFLPRHLSGQRPWGRVKVWDFRVQARFERVAPQSHCVQERVRGEQRVSIRLPEMNLNMWKALSQKIRSPDCFPWVFLRKAWRHRVYWQPRSCWDQRRIEQMNFPSAIPPAPAPAEWKFAKSFRPGD